MNHGSRYYTRRQTLAGVLIAAADVVCRVSDERLVTGQNPASAGGIADAVVELLRA